MNKSKSLKKMSILGIFLNLILLILKISVGALTKNQTILADGLNSAGDIISSILSYIGNKISSTPKDSEHPYGHGKAEYIFSMIIGLILISVSFSIFRTSLNSLLTKNTFIYSPYLSIVALFTIMVKISLYFYCIKIYKNFNSLLALASATDHRNDIFITSLTFVSIIAGYYNMYFIDGIGGMLISIWLCYSSFKIVLNAYNVLMDKNIDKHMIVHYAKIIEKINGVAHIDEIVSRPTGLNFILIVKISVDGYMTVIDSHKIASKVKYELIKDQMVSDVIVHINPVQNHEKKMNY